MVSILFGAVSQGLLWAIMVIGVYLTYRILDIADLSVEGIITLGGFVAARLITVGLAPWLSTLCALAAGLAGGLITGLLHTKLKIPALLSGILTMTAMWSINLRVGDRSNLPLLKVDTVYTPIQELLEAQPALAGLMKTLGGSKSAASFLVGLIIAIFVALLIYWFFGTELGSAIRATGANPNMVRAQGVDTATMITLGLMISNGLVALSGALIAQAQSFADIQMGIGSIVIGLASLIIGEVLFGTRSFKNSLISIILGAIIYRVIIALVMKAGLASNDLKLFTAIIVAICLFLPNLQKELQTRKKLRQDQSSISAGKGGEG
jgi:putative ABC transport system permease protein